MVQLEVPPEQPTECVGQPEEGGVVDADLAFPQIVDQQIAHRSAFDAAAVDQLCHGELPLVVQCPHGRCSAVTENAHGVQQLVEEVRGPVVGDGADLGSSAVTIENDAG